MTRFYDLRLDRKPEKPKVKLVRGQPVWREPSKVDAIVIHQTAAAYGASAAQVKAAGGDRELALARRALRVACHAMAFRGGFYVAAAPLRWYVQHGNGLNAQSLGLEIDGLYSGLEDDPETFPRREDRDTTWSAGAPCVLTETTIEAAREALRWLVETGRAEGMPIEYVYAHRQSSATRRSDPGAAIWREIVEAYAIPVLGLRSERGRTWGDGRAIPVEWSPAGEGAY
jgi:hypothetical protein